MSEFDKEKIKAAGQKAVDLFVSELGSEFATGRHLMAVEMIDAEGEKFMYSTAGDGMKAWESLGIIEYLRQVEQGYIVSDALEG